MHLVFQFLTLKQVFNVATQMKGGGTRSWDLVARVVYHLERFIDHEQDDWNTFSLRG